MGHLKHSSMDIIESDRGLTEKGRENYDLIFCPFKCNPGMGEGLSMHRQCDDCKMEMPDSYAACVEKYKSTLPGAKKT